MLEIPGVPGLTEEGRFGRRGDSELRGRRLAEDDEAGPLVPLHELAVVIGHAVSEQHAPVRRALALVEKMQVLEEEGDSAKRPVRKPGVDRAAGLLLHVDDDRIEGRIAIRGPGNRRVEELRGVHFARPDPLGETDRIVGLVIIGRHRRLPEFRRDSTAARAITPAGRGWVSDARRLRGTRHGGPWLGRGS